MDLNEALDRLYAVPLDEFTATRNELSAELAKSGDPDAGREVKSLKKPNLAAWALNQLARRHADELAELYEATDRVRHAQRRVLSGGKATTLREATEARAKVVTRLTKLAGEILTESGHAAAPATLSAIGASLIGVGSDPESAEALRAGRLTREVRAETVVDVGGLTLVEGRGEDEVAEETPSDPEKAAVAAVRAARATLDEARRRAEEAGKAAREADAEERQAGREVEDAERRLKAAREGAEFARRAAEARRTDASEADEALERARKALDEAEESS